MNPAHRSLGTGSSPRPGPRSSRPGDRSSSTTSGRGTTSGPASASSAGNGTHDSQTPVAGSAPGHTNGASRANGTARSATNGRVPHPEMEGTDDIMDPLVAVSERHGLDPLGARLSELKDWLVDDLLELEAGIDALHVPEPDLARRAASHLVRLPGKRIRPLCVLLAARIGGRSLDAVVKDLAISCELVHAATLLHDDVLDVGEERRGEPTARVVYGNSASILGGDYLLIESLRRVNQAGESQLLTNLLQVIDRMVHAEALQLERRERFDPRRSIYLEVIEGKTASLFRWGLEAGATVAGLPRADVEALAEVGFHFGMSFQLTDDAIDLSGDPETTGKTPFTDVKEGKLTWPLIVGCERDPSIQAELASILEDPSRVEEEPRMIELARRLQAVGATDETRRYAAEHAALAIGRLQTLAPSKARDAIQAVIEAVVQRAS